MKLCHQKKNSPSVFFSFVTEIIFTSLSLSFVFFLQIFPQMCFDCRYCRFFVTFAYKNNTVWREFFPCQKFGNDWSHNSSDKQSTHSHTRRERGVSECVCVCMSACVWVRVYECVCLSQTQTPQANAKMKVGWKNPGKSY
jgi:hypothetical protein